MFHEPLFAKKATCLKWIIWCLQRLTFSTVSVIKSLLIKLTQLLPSTSPRKKSSHQYESQAKLGAQMAWRPLSHTSAVRAPSAQAPGPITPSSRTSEGYLYMSSRPIGGWTQWDSCSEPPSMCPCRCDHSLRCWRRTFLTRGGRAVSFLKECADTDITVWHPGKHTGVLTVTPQASATCRCHTERVATASPAPQEGLLWKLVTRKIKIPPHLEKDSPSTTGCWWPMANSCYVWPFNLAG